MRRRRRRWWWRWRRRRRPTQQLPRSSGPPRGSACRCCFCRCLTCLTPSLPRCRLKRTHKIAKFETLTPFCLLFHTGMWGEKISKTHSTENRCYRTGKHIRRRVRALFSPEILQAGAVKGLIRPLCLLELQVLASKRGTRKKTFDCHHQNSSVLEWAVVCVTLRLHPL